MKTSIAAGLIALFLGAPAFVADAEGGHSSHLPGPPAVVAGTVTDARSGGPLSGAQVSVVQGRMGALTDARGRFHLELPGLATGDEVTLRVERVGYASVERTLSLSGTATTADFALEPAALALDEVVITGQAADKARRALGSTVEAVQPSTYETAPSPAGAGARYSIHHPRAWPGGESYARIEENGFRTVSTSPLSTFSIDVDRASYANVRRFIQSGVRPPVDAVRVEEMINYFPYEWAEVRGEHPFHVTTEVWQAPWNPANRLVRVGLKARSIDMEDLPANNLVFLLDVSGSMNSPDKLPLLKKAFSLLVEQLREEDRVSIVVYAGAAGLVLPSTSGHHQDEILGALERLEAGGSTAGGAGLQLAYRVARDHFVEGGNNRIILATDGDFNVGPSSDAEMVRLIEKEREGGTFLTVLGFGTGNLKDSKMEQIADHGNGNFAYVDNLLEARKVLVEEMGGTLLTLAKDVKLQIEFNPARAHAYRLIGYENRLLADEDFNDDTKDAGELGAGHTVTALYEVVPPGGRTRGDVDPLRYGPPPEVETEGTGETGDELMFVKLRYKAPDGLRSRLLEHVVRDEVDRPTRDFRFAAAVAGFGMLLRESPHAGSLTLEAVIEMAEEGQGPDLRGYRGEFIRLVEATRDLGLLPRHTEDREH